MLENLSMMLLSVTLKTGRMEKPESGTGTGAGAGAGAGTGTGTGTGART